MTSQPPADSAPKPPAGPDIPVIDVRQLVGEGREIVLMHQGEAYRLRITARDRLILTK